MDPMMAIRAYSAAQGAGGPTGAQGVAAPGFDMYYLNVMSGPGAERAWKISDHPDQGWIRDTWADQDVDPRLTLTTKKG